GQAATHRGGARDDQELATVRRGEFAASCEILKVRRGIVLDYPDGKLHRQDLYRVVCDLTLLVRQFRLQVMLTFGSEGGLKAHNTQAPLCPIVEGNVRQRGRMEMFHLAAAVQPMSCEMETDLFTGIDENL